MTVCFRMQAHASLCTGSDRVADIPTNERLPCTPTNGCGQGLFENVGVGVGAKNKAWAQSGDFVCDFEGVFGHFCSQNFLYIAKSSFQSTKTVAQLASLVA